MGDEGTQVVVGPFIDALVASGVVRSPTDEKLWARPKGWLLRRWRAVMPGAVKGR